jgi:hypothetical protein
MENMMSFYAKKYYSFIVCTAYPCVPPVPHNSPTPPHPHVQEGQTEYFGTEQVPEGTRKAIFFFLSSQCSTLCTVPRYLRT